VPLVEWLQSLLSLKSLGVLSPKLSAFCYASFLSVPVRFLLARPCVHLHTHTHTYTHTHTRHDTTVTYILGQAEAVEELARRGVDLELGGLSA